MKYSVANYKFAEEIEDTQTTKETTTEETKKEESEEDSGPEDNVAQEIRVGEYKKIEDVLRQSMTSFMKKAEDSNGKTELMTPSINKRLGVGLAAVVSRKLAESREKFTQALSDDDSYYDEEDDKSVKREFSNINKDDDSYYDEEEDTDSPNKFKIGKGFDSDDDLDLTEFTEEDVMEKKLELLHDKLEKEYQEGLDPKKDPNKLIEMKTMRLTFLNIGPIIQNLEFFEKL